MFCDLWFALDVELNELLFWLRLMNEVMPMILVQIAVVPFSSGTWLNICKQISLFKLNSGGIYVFFKLNQLSF